MNKLIAIGTLSAIAMTAQADPRYYVEYKNDLIWDDGHYLDNSARNNLRLGVQGEVFYVEAGPVENHGNYGTSYEVGYKYGINESWQIKGKLEGYQFDSWEGDVGSKFETEVRYYFN